MIKTLKRHILLILLCWKCDDKKHWRGTFSSFLCVQSVMHVLQAKEQKRKSHTNNEMGSKEHDTLWSVKVRYPGVRRWFLVRQVPFIRNQQNLPCIFLFGIEDKQNMEEHFLLTGWSLCLKITSFTAKRFCQNPSDTRENDSFRGSIKLKTVRNCLGNFSLPRDLLPISVFFWRT